jgi:hypothetical protein
MDLTVDSLVQEAQDASRRLWFVKDFNTVEQTNATVTLRLIVGPSLFVQAFSAKTAGD